MSRQAFDNLIAKYSQQVLNTALRVLGNEAMAMDVHQEVFMAVWKRWDLYDHQVSWSSYLYRITIRKALDQVRINRNTVSLDNIQYENTRACPPDQAMAEQELQAKLTKWISELPAKQAEVFILNRHEGLNYQDIAKVLSCKEATVRVHMFRAVQALGKKMHRFLKITGK